MIARVVHLRRERERYGTTGGRTVTRSERYRELRTCPPFPTISPRRRRRMRRTGLTILRPCSRGSLRKPRPAHAHGTAEPEAVRPPNRSPLSLLTCSLAIPAMHRYHTP